MSFRSDPLDRLAIPDGTTVEEHDLVTDGDVVVGGQSAVEFGVRGRNVIAGERVRFGGDIEASEDCRLDMWCDVAGNVLVGRDAYLGERVHVAGQLMVSGDLDIGDDVDIEEGFEANGWIVIRNPVPTIVFLFIYLSQLLRLGEEEAAEELMGDLQHDPKHDPLLIPRSARVSDDAWEVSTPADIGANCRIHGNIRAESMSVGRDTEIFGSLRAKGDITVGTDAVVHGDVTTRGGIVRVESGAHVRGDVSCEDVVLDDAAEVDGTIRARGEVSISQAPDHSEAPPDPGTTSHEDPSDAVGVPEPAVTRVPPSEDDDLVAAVTRVEGNEGISVDIPDAEEAAENDDKKSTRPEPDIAGDGLAGTIAEAEKR